MLRECPIKDIKKNARLSEIMALIVDRPQKWWTAWEESKESWMAALMEEKFGDAELRNALLRTGERPLIYELTTAHVTDDKFFWGHNCKTGRGQNRLGKILMEIRNMLRDGSLN